MLIQKNFKWLMLAVTIMFLATSMMGCGPTATDTSVETAVPGEPTVPGPTATADPNARFLRVAVAAALGTDVLDPMLAGSEAAERQIGAIFESLMGRDLQGNVVPLLATSYEGNADNTVWTIHLREGVQFHGGWGEMTADDVKFSIDRFASEDSIPAAANRLRQLNVEVQVIDKYTVEIHTDPFPNFVAFVLSDGAVNSVGWVMSKAYYESAGDEGFKTFPIGTGEYKFVQFIPKDSLLLEVNREYWGAIPAFEKVLIMEVPEESARIAMLNNGTADLIDASPDAAINLADQGFDYKVVLHVANETMYFHGTWRPEVIEQNLCTSHVEVRQALSLAIDRKTINETMFRGMFDPVPLPGRSSVTPQIGWSQASIDKWKVWAEANYIYDPVKAKELLTQAGFPNGCDITVWSYNGPRDTWTVNLWEVIASYWEQIGVTAHLNQTDWTGWFRPARNTIPQSLEFIGADKGMPTVSIHSLAYPDETVARSVVIYGFPKYSTHQLQDENNPDLVALFRQLEESNDEVLFNQALDAIANSWVAPTLFYTGDPYVVSAKVAEWQVMDGTSIPSLWFQTFIPAN